MIEKDDYNTFYKKAFQLSDLAIFVCKVYRKQRSYAYKFLEINPTYHKLTGISIENIKGKTLDELNSLFPDPLWINMKEHLDICAHNYRMVEYETKVSMRGRTLFCYTKLHPIVMDNHIQYILGMSIDISKLKFIEKELQDQYFLLDNLLKSSPVGIGVVDSEYKLIYYNWNFLKIWDLNEQLVKKQKPLFFHIVKKVRNKKKAYPKLMEIVRNNKRARIRYLFLENKVIEMLVHPLFENENVSSKKVIGYIGIYIDRTKEFIQQKQLKKALSEAKLANKSKSEFLANISHELRTPLTTIMGVTEILLKQTSSGDVKKYLKMIFESSSYLLNLIQDILDLSSIELGTLTVKNHPFSLSKPVELLVQTYQLNCKKKQIQFVYNTNLKTYPVIIGDEKRLYQVLNNLLSNALKFTSFGTIKFRVLKQKETNHTIDLLFEIEDTGIGIAKEQLPYIFERFRKIDEFNVNPQGIGIGLSLVKEYVNIMKGKLEVDSQLGKGTKFVLQFCFRKFLDVKEKKQKQFSYDEIIEKFSYIMKGRKVLIAEDSLEIQLLIKKFLKDTGLEFEIVSNGIEVLEKVQNHEYDLIFLDIRMPVLDGISTFRKLKKILKKDIPIAALTAHAMEENIQLTKKLGFSAHIIKPFSRKELLVQIIKLLKNYF